MPAERRGERVLVDLVHDRGRALAAYAYLLTGDGAAAQDLVQDAVVKTFVRTRAGLDPDVAEAYVRRAILNLYIDGFRRAKQVASFQHLVAVPQDRTSDDAVAQRVDLHRALATLAPQERACVVLRFYEDLTVPQVAHHMGLSAGTVKRYLSNAVHKLEDRLGPMPQLDLAATDEVAVITTARTRTGASTLWSGR